jgi:hypothetical protein
MIVLAFVKYYRDYEKLFCETSSRLQEVSRVFPLEANALGIKPWTGAGNTFSLLGLALYNMFQDARHVA